MTFGRAIATRFAKTKGLSLGVIASSQYPQRVGKFSVDEAKALGQMLHVIWTREGMRACDDEGHAISSLSALRYLQNAFGNALAGVKAAMKELADSYTDPELLDSEAYALYTHFRPSVASREAGWGAKGDLDLNRLKALAYSPTRGPVVESRM